MPHNHSPRCCCTQPDHSIRATPETCPSCVEHGELASLNSQPLPGCNCAGDLHEECANAQPPQCPEESPSTGARCLRIEGHPGMHQPAECPSCHTTDGHPHTDYCQMPPEARELAARMLADDLANGYLPDGTRTAMAQTSQPAATTSQPPTHTRGPGGPITSGQPYTLKRGEGTLTHLEHAMPGGRTHLRALCRPDLCGQQPTPSQ